MGYEGDEFVGLDEDAFGDGDSQTSPVSTHLHQRLNGNYIYLSRGRSAFSWQPIVNNSANSGPTGFVGDRPWASLSWISVGLWYFPASRGFEGLDITGIVRVADAYATANAAVELRFELGEAKKTVRLTDTAQIGYVGFFETLDLPEPWDEPDEHIPLRIFMRSEPGINNPLKAQQTLTGRGFYLEGDSGTIGTMLDDSASGNPNVDSLETQGIRITSTVTNPLPYDSRDYDLLFTRNGGTVVTTRRAFVAPPDVRVAYSANVFIMGYLQVRGLAFRPRYSKAAASAVGKRALRAKIPVDASPLARIAYGLQEIYERPVVLSVGPRGILDPNAEDFSGIDYPIRWPYADGVGFGTTYNPGYDRDFGSVSVSFSAAARTITRTSGTWLGGGGDSVRVGGRITVTGSPSNDGQYYVRSVTSTVITVRDDDSLNTEGPVSATFTHSLPKVLIDDICKLDQQRPRLEVRALVMAAHLRQTFRKPGPGVSSNPFDGDEVGRATWRFRLRVDRLSIALDPLSTTWAQGTEEVANRAWERAVKLYPAAAESPFLTMRNVYHMDYGDPGGSPVDFAYKEGSVYGDELGILTPIQFSVRLGDSFIFSDDNQNAIRVRLEANSTSGPGQADGLGLINWTSIEGRNLAQLRLLLAGYTITSRVDR